MAARNPKASLQKDMDNLQVKCMRATSGASVSQATGNMKVPSFRRPFLQVAVLSTYMLNSGALICLSQPCFLSPFGCVLRVPSFAGNAAAEFSPQNRPFGLCIAQCCCMVLGRETLQAANSLRIVAAGVCSEFM